MLRITGGFQCESLPGLAWSASEAIWQISSSNTPTLRGRIRLLHVAQEDRLPFVGLIVEVLIAERERTVNLQQDAIRELSTPVLQLRERLLILPMIGLIDSMRATTDEWFAALDP